MNKKSLLAASAVILLPGIALAEAISPPEFHRVPGLTYNAEVFGLQTWTDDSSKMLWMHDPASGQIIVGYPFDANGHVMHPALADTPVGIDNLIDELFKLNEVVIPEAYVPSVEDLLSMLPEDIRTHVIRDFVLRVRTVDTEEAYNTAVAGWIDELKGVVLQHNPEANVENVGQAPAEVEVAKEAPPEQIEAEHGTPEALTPAVEVLTEAAQEDVDDQSAAVAPSEPQNTQVHIRGLDGAVDEHGNGSAVIWEPEVIDGVSLRDAMRSIPADEMGGRGDTRIAVMLDPTCTECQSSWIQMRDSLRQANVTYDVHIVPAYSEDSYALIAGLDTSGNFTQAVTDLMAGNSEMLGRWSDVPEDQRVIYYARQDLIGKYKIPALPLFISDTKYVSGELTPELLEELIAE